MGEPHAAVDEGLAPDAVVGLADQRRAAAAMSPRSAIVRLIGPDNEGRGEEEWSETVAAVPHAVRLAHMGRFHTIALDFDTKLNGVDAAQYEAEAVHDMLTEVGVRSVIAESGPGGGRHVIFTVASPGISKRDGTKLAEGLRGLGFRSYDSSQMTNAATGAIRPLFSVHREGGRSMPLYVTPEAAIKVLENPNDPALVESVIGVIWKLSTPLPLKLPAAARQTRIQSTPRPNEECPSGSEPFMSFALRAANSGVRDVHEFESMFASVPPDTVLGDYLDRRGHERLTNLRTLNKAITKVLADPARYTGVSDGVVLVAWEKALPLIEDALTPVAYAAAEAVLGLACHVGRVLVGVGVRDLALLIGAGRSSAGDALVELRAAGMIEVAGESATGTSRRHRLVHPDRWTVEAARTVGPSLEGGVSPQTVQGASTRPPELMTSAAVRIWSAAGLGEHGRRVWVALVEACGVDGNVGSQVLADAVGRSRRAVDTTLKMLQQHGLAYRPPARGRWAPDFPSIEAVEKSLGIEEITARRRESYRREALRDRVRRVIHDMEQDEAQGDAAAA